MKNASTSPPTADSTVANPDDPISTEANTRRKKRKSRRRWRRLLLFFVLAGVVAALLGYWGRCVVAEFILDRSLAGFAAQELGLPVSVGDTRVREHRDGRLTVEVRKLRIGDETTPELFVRARNVTAELAGWRELRGGLSAIQRVVVDSSRVVLPPFDHDSEDESGQSPSTPLVLPDPLPRLPFIVELRDVLVVGAGWSARVNAELTPDRAEVDLDGIEGLTIELEKKPIHLRTLSASADLSKDGITGLEVAVDPLALRLRGDLSRRPGRTRAESTVYAGDLSFTLPGGQGSYGVRVPTVAHASTTLVGSLRLDDPVELATRLGLDVKLPAPIILSTSIDVSATHTQVDGELEIADGTVSLRGKLSAAELDLVVKSHRFDLGALTTLYEVTGAPKGVATGTLTIQGPLTEPRFGANLDVESASVSWEEKNLSFDTLHLEAGWAPGGVLDLTELKVGVWGGSAEAIGTIAIDDESPWELTFSFERWDIARVRSWVEGARAMSGVASGSGRLRGPWSGFDYEIEARVTDGVAAFDNFEGRFRDVELNARVVPGRLEMSDGSATLGGGTVTGSGYWATAAENEETAVKLDLELERVRLFRTRDVWARGSGQVDVVIPAAALTELGDRAPGAAPSRVRPKLTANLTIDRGVYDRNIYPRLREGSSVPFDLFTIEDGLAAETVLDVQAQLNGGFLIRNNYLSVAPFGSLRLGGTGRQPVLTGRVSTTDGKVKLPHLSLTIQRAEVVFPDDDPFNPTLEFQGSGPSAGVEIEAIASGALMNPEVTFSSVPYIPQEDLLLLVASGRRRAQIEGERVEQVAALEVARLYGPEVWERIFGRSRGESFLDRISISTEPAGDGGADQIKVELRWLDWLSVVGERDERGNLNLDLEAFRWFR